MLAGALKIVREKNPTRLVVVGPVGWNNINELAKLQLPEDDRRLVVTVHYYEPFHFTHQGAEWAGPEAAKWLGTKWTDTPQERQAVARDFDKAIRWAVKHKRPIYLGEFGAYSKARHGIACPLDPLRRRRGREAEDGHRLLGILLRLRGLRPEEREVDRTAEKVLVEPVK